MSPSVTSPICLTKQEGVMSNLTLWLIWLIFLSVLITCNNYFWIKESCSLTKKLIYESTVRIYPVSNFMFIVKNKQIQWLGWGLFQFLYEDFQTKIFWRVAKPYSYPASNYMFKVNNRNTRARCEICLKLAKKTPERR